jgi:hypothetical protein
LLISYIWTIVKANIYKLLVIHLRCVYGIFLFILHCISLTKESSSHYVTLLIHTQLFYSDTHGLSRKRKDFVPQTLARYQLWRLLSNLEIKVISNNFINSIYYFTFGSQELNFSWPGPSLCQLACDIMYQWYVHWGKKKKKMTWNNPDSIISTVHPSNYVSNILSLYHDHFYYIKKILQRIKLFSSFLRM